MIMIIPGIRQAVHGLLNFTPEFPLECVLPDLKATTLIKNSSFSLLFVVHKQKNLPLNNLSIALAEDKPLTFYTAVRILVNEK